MQNEVEIVDRFRAFYALKTNGNNYSQLVVPLASKKRFCFSAVKSSQAQTISSPPAELGHRCCWQSTYFRPGRKHCLTSLEKETRTGCKSVDANFGEHQSTLRHEKANAFKIGELCMTLCTHFQNGHTFCIYILFLEFYHTQITGVAVVHLTYFVLS